MTHRILVSALLVSILPFAEAFARLDTIDADGVTETGGTPDRARMLPRTKADGKLDASLLPSLGALASIPDPKRLYVSATAQPDGNGSALSPFQTLQEAVEAVDAGGAILIAPGTNSASWTLPAGSAVTLVGSGPQTVLTLTAAASSSELVLVNAAVPSLTVNGGAANVRLIGTQVALVAGNASPLTVSRTDLGSTAGVLPSGATDAYTGHDTVPYATAVKGGTATLTLSGTRPVVGAETGAFLSDLTAATNAVQGTIELLRAAGEALAGAIEAEAALREAGDAAQGLALTNATDALRIQIAEIGSNWDTQLQDIIRHLTNETEQVIALSTKETNDVANLEAEDIQIRADFASADTTLHTTITGEIVEKVDDLDERISGEIETLKGSDASIIHNYQAADVTTLSSAKTYTNKAIENLTNQLNAVQTTLGTVQSNLNTLKNWVTSRHPEITPPW